MASDGGSSRTLMFEALCTSAHSVRNSIRELLNAGADVNAIAGHFDDIEYSLREWREAQDPSSPFYSPICEKHSALTLASSFRCPELVDFLIRNGAEISFHIDGARSALRECLYNSVERYLSVRRYPLNRQRLTLVDRCEEYQHSRLTWVSRVLETSKTLIMAGVDVNDHKLCHPSGRYCKVHFDLECYSAFDLGILTQDRDLIDALWTAGARPTGHSFDLALRAGDYDTFCQLLESEADFPGWLVIPGDRPDTDDDEPWYMESRNATEREKKEAMILAAIRVGAYAGLETLARSYDCSNIVENYDALQKAIQKCSARGHRDTLVCLLQSNILPQGSLASVSGSSIALAIDRGHLETAEVLLAAGADVNAGCRVVVEDTPLQLAIRGKRKALVQKLLDYGAEVETPIRGNLLVEAIHHGDHDIVQLLMAHASPNNWGSHGDAVNPMVTPLAAAILGGQWAICDQLLQLGASVSPRSQEGRPLLWHTVPTLRNPAAGTPLWASVQRKRFTTAEWLIKNGASANDQLALQAAAEDEDSDLLRLLVEKLSSEGRGGEENALHMALQTAMGRGSLKNFHLILQSKVLDVRRLSKSLHHALESPVAHRQELLRSLIKAGACANTALTHDFHCGPHTALLEAILHQDPRCVEIILGTRARTHEELPPGTAYSPLQLASFYGNAEIVRMLLDHGQDPDVALSCTQHQCWLFKNNPTLHPDGTCVQNATTAKAYGSLKALLQHGAKPDATTRNCPHSALQIACREGSLELVEVLIEYGADVNRPPAREFGATALQFAAIGGYLGIAHLLLEKGADVNAKPAEFEGRTALEGAAEHGRIDMVQLLRNAGAESSESGQGQYERALERALKHGHHATAKLLRSYLL